MGAACKYHSREDYHSYFPDSDFLQYINLRKYNPLFDRLHDLYVMVGYKWIEQLMNGVFVTIDIYKADKLSTYNKRKWPFTHSDLYQHITGRKTVGVFPARYETKFLIFDVDTLNFDVVRMVYNSLLKFFSKEQIMIHFTGKKGYHVTIFFETPAARVATQYLFNHILDECRKYCYKYNLPEEIFNKVECRGGLSNQGVKLPMGINYGNKVGDNRTYFVDSCGNKIKDERYIFEIEKVHTGEFIELLEEQFDFDMSSLVREELVKIQEIKKEIPVNTEIRKKSNKNFLLSQTEYIDKIRKEGIDGAGTRHSATLQLSICLKMEGYSRSDAESYLMEWHTTLNNPAFYTTSLKDVEKEIKAIVKTVWNDDKYKLQTTNEILLSQYEIEEIMSVRDRKLRAVYFLMTCHAKKVQAVESFFMTYKQMSEAGLAKNRSSLKRMIDELETMGKVKVLERDRLKPSAEWEFACQKYPNRYCLPAYNRIAITSKDIKYKLNIEDLEAGYIDMIAKKVFIPVELKEYYSKNQLTQLKKVNESTIELEKIDEKEKSISLNVMQRAELDSVKDTKLKKYYVLMLLNAIANGGENQEHLLDYDFYVRGTGETNKDEFFEILCGLESLGKLHIEIHDEYFMYKLVKFQKTSVDIKKTLTDICGEELRE